MLVEIFCRAWGENLSWENKSILQPHESKYLKLDCSKIKYTFNWSPSWNITTAIEKAVEWYKIYSRGGDLIQCMTEQLAVLYHGGGGIAASIR